MLHVAGADGRPVLTPKFGKICRKCLSVCLSVCPTMFQVKCIAVYLFAQPVSKASPNNAGLEISNKDFCQEGGGGRRGQDKEMVEREEFGMGNAWKTEK